MQRDYGKDLRKYISNNYNIKQIIDFGDGQVFENAMTYTGIFIFQNAESSKSFLFKKFTDKESLETFKRIDFAELDASYTKNETWYFDNSENTILPIIKENCVQLEDVTSGIIQGIATGKDSVFIVDLETVKNEKLEENCLQKILKGKDISTWKITWDNKYLIYPYDTNGNVIDEKELQNKFPYTYSYLVKNRKELEGREYFDKSNKKWFELWNQRSLKKFQCIKIVTLDNASKNSFAIDTNNLVGTTTVYSIIPNSDINPKYLLGILNSKVLNYYHKKNTIPQAGGFYRYQALFIKGLPIKKVDVEKQITIANLIDYIIYLNDENSAQILTHTANERISSHIEDLLNMIVYELYFEAHMKEVGIDVLQFINPEPLENSPIKEKVIGDFYLWYQMPENPVRQRILLVETRSKNIIALINKSTT